MPEHRTHRRSPADRTPVRRVPVLLLAAPGVVLLVALTVLAVGGLLGGGSVPARADAAAPTTAAAVPSTSSEAASADPPAGLRAAAATTTPPAPPGSATPGASGAETRIEDRDTCTAQYVACVDLRTQRAWLQRGAEVTYGPTPIMPGTQTHLLAPGPDSSATPTGSFTVLYKNATQVSSEFDEPMPHAVFFAEGGIAFHEGSLAGSSHGCVHLGAAAATAFFDQLQPGDPVLVF